MMVSCSTDPGHDEASVVDGGHEPASPDPDAVEALQRVAADEVVVAALEHVHTLEAQTNADHIFLTEIPAPPFKEAERARHFAAMLETAGADSVWIDEVGNVLALRKGIGSGRTLGVGAHLDTVFPEGTDVTVKIRGDTLFAPGVGDDSRGLVVVLTLLRVMEHTGLQNRDDILFIGTVGEEGLGDLRGMKHLFGDAGQAHRIYRSKVHFHPCCERNGIH